MDTWFPPYPSSSLITCGVFVAGNLSAEFTSITGLSEAHVFAGVALTHLALNLPALPMCASGFISRTQNATRLGGIIDQGGGTLGNLPRLERIQKGRGWNRSTPFLDKLFPDQESSILMAFSTSPNRFGSMLVKLMTAERFIALSFISPV